VLGLIAMEDEDKAKENLDELQVEHDSMEGDMDGLEDRSSAFEEDPKKGEEESKEDEELGSEESDQEDDDDDVYEENLLCCAVCSLPPEPPMLRCWHCDKFYHRACLGSMSDDKWDTLAFAPLWPCNECKPVVGDLSTAIHSTARRKKR